MDCGQVMIYRNTNGSNKQILGFKKDFEMNFNGQLFFTLNGSFEKKYGGNVFPVEFFFYKKGKPFYITAKGVAERSFLKEHETGEKISSVPQYIKAKIDSIEYITLNTTGSKGSFHRGINTISGM